MRTITKTLRLTQENQAESPYFYVPFAVPMGTSRIDVSMAYDKADDCVIDLGCADPRLGAFPSEEGFRGWSGGARKRFFVATDDATPGYVHGPMPAGEWNVMLGLYKIPENGAEVRIDISIDDAARSLSPSPVRSRPIRPGAGWYKGDLHCHTHHSDAKGGPRLLHRAAKQAGLDFLAVSDHNTTTQRRYFHPRSSSDLVFVRAMEITTAAGHANVFGVDDWIDFRMTRPDDPHVIADLVHKKGGLLSINHDKPPHPWNYEWPAADCMEVWQSTWMAWNWVSLERYQQRLASGLRLSAIGGSDYHQPSEEKPEGPLVLARPTTVLWLEELSEDAVIEAMRAGRGYVTEAPDGPHLSLTADGHPMGARLLAEPGRIEAHVRGAEGDWLSFIDARGEIDRTRIHGDDKVLVLDRQPKDFVRCEIIAGKSRKRLLKTLQKAFSGKPLPHGLKEEELEEQPLRRALSNPIYFSGGA